MNIFSYYLYLFLEKVFANITSKIIVVSKADLDIGIKNRIACANKFQLIYYGVDIDQFENIFSQRISMIPKENLIITVSALKKQKGLDYFLQAAQIISKKHADAKFLIIGDGPKRSAIELKINNFGLQDRVVLKGWVDDLTEFYLKTKLMVVSSLWEGLPVAIIEAVLSGVAVVATDTGGVRDIIKDNRSGVIVDRADINSLAKASLDVLDNFKAWQDKIAANRNSIVFSEWSSEKMINQLHGLYSSFS
jgi:glycosyltransferase involved in cell wall biosynthesis